jgi:PAS domain S-box-containing protein
MMPLRFLLLEDNPLDADKAESALLDGGINCDLLRVETRADFVAALETDEFDLILSDYSLPEFDGISALDIACTLRPELPFIFVSGSLGEELAIETLKRGATDYVLKQRLGRLVPCVCRALREAQERRERKLAEQALQQAHDELAEQALQLEQTNEDLRTALEEFQVIEEELRQQNEQLANAHQAIATERQRYQDLFNFAPDGYVITDAVGIIQAANCAMAALLGCEPDQLMGVPLRTYLFQPDRTAFRNFLYELGQQPQLQTAELSLQPPKKGVIPIDLTATPVHDAEGRYVGARWLIRDITDRKQAEAALRESEARFRSFAANSSDVIWITDAKQYRLIYVSPSYEQVWGHPAAEIYADLTRFIELIHPDDRDRIQAGWQQCTQGGFSQEYRVIRPDGAIVWIHDRGFPIYNDRGELLYLGGIAEDITERKHIEADRQQAEAEIQQLNHQLTQRVNELQTLFDLLPIGVAIAEDPECRVIRANLHMSELLRMPVEANASHSAPADERPLYRLCRDGQEIAVEALPMQFAAAHNTAVRDEVVDLVHPDGTLVKLLCSASPLLDGQGKVRGVLGSFIDITQRVLDENALRQSESRFRRIFECNMIGMGIWTKAGGITEANDALLNMLGYTRQDLEAGRVKWNEITPPEQLWLDERSLAEIETRGICTPFEKEYIHKEGQRIPILIGGGSFADTPNAGVFFTIDLSDRKQIEEALRQSESRFRLMVESAKEYAIFTLDLNGTITSWNSGAERLLGYSEPEAIGCNGRMIFTPEDNKQKRAEREMHLALTQGRAENERWHVRKDGSRFWGSGLVMPLQSEAGDTQGFVKIMQDKTAQRQAEQRLHLLYETTRDLLATEHPMQLMDNLFSKLSSQLSLHSYYNYMVEEQGDRSRLHLRNYGGISEDAAQSIAWIEFGQYLCGVVAQARRPLVLDRSQLSTHPNAQLVCSNGITAYAGYPLIAQGRLMGTLSFASLTRTRFTPGETALLQSTCEQMAIALERAELTASLQRQAEQLQRANHIKDEFLAMLSHELRSPLNPILGWAKLLQTGNLNATKTAQALSVIERNAKLQSELIEDLLDVSRILRGKLSLETRPVDLKATIQAAMETVRLSADAKAIDLRFTILDFGLEEDNNPKSKIQNPKSKIQNPKLQVMGDANRLQQVVWNLLSNAIKFTPEGGQVEVQLDKVMGNGAWVMGKEQSQQPITDHPLPITEYAQLTVTDTGKGIHPEFLPHVFDYFRQEDGATTRKFGGLGLGLAIVRHLVELHGGTVQVESPGEGLGATFTVKLPLLKGEGERRKAEGGLDSSLISHPSSVPLTGLRILVVDDIADTREVIAFLLEMYGATVAAVDSGVEAIAALTQFKADVLVSDIGMPDMDGYMLMRQIRALPSEQGGTIPAIALTAYAGEIDYQQAMMAGFQKHVPKPVEPAKLVGAIVELVFDNRVRN